MGGSKPKAPPPPKLTGQLASARQQAITDLQRQASGRGPSVTREQLKAAQERTLAAQLAAAQARPTNNQSGAMRQLIAERGATGRELAQAAAQGQAAEAQGARSTLVGITEDELNRQAGAAAQEAQRQMEIARQRNQMTGSMIGAAAQVGGQMANSYYTNRQAPMTQEQILEKYKNQAAGSAAPQSGSAISQQMLPFESSDETIKSNKAPADKKMKSFLDALSAQQYNYKKETGLDTKKKFGIMAQDLEKSEVGKSLVKEIGGIKHVDMNRGFSAILAAQADLNKRLDKVEKK